eukprot:1194621-Prorocentrum_minimum.AAC.3
MAQTRPPAVMARLKEMLGTKPEVAAKEKWRKWDRCWCVAGEGEQGLCVRRAQRHHGYQPPEEKEPLTKEGLAAAARLQTKSAPMAAVGLSPAKGAAAATPSPANKSVASKTAPVGVATAGSSKGTAAVGGSREKSLERGTSRESRGATATTGGSKGHTEKGSDSKHKLGRAKNAKGREEAGGKAQQSSGSSSSSSASSSSSSSADEKAAPDPVEELMVIGP